MIKKYLACAISLFLTTFAANAQKGSAAPLVPLPSVPDFTGGDGWGLGLGLTVEYESAYEGSDEFEFELNPAGAVQWRKGNHTFAFLGEAIGWQGLLDESWLLQAYVGFDEGREESDSDDGRLDGLGDGDEGAEFLFEARRALDPEWRNWLDARVVTGDSGSLGLFGFGHRFGSKNDGTGGELGIVATFHDSEYANSDFGIDAEQSAASMLAETDLDGGYRSVGVNYNHRYNINDHWQLIGEVLYEHYGSDIADSPISRENFEAEVEIGVLYVF